MTKDNFSQNAYFTVRCADILGVSPDAPHYAVNAALLKAREAETQPKHLISLAYDWLSCRSATQRKADMLRYEQDRYAALDEVIEMEALKQAVASAKRAASAFVGYYSVFAGCRIKSFHGGREITVDAPGRLQGVLAV